MPLQINDLDVCIGKNIREFRKKRRWGMKVLSHKISISIQQLQKYETATNKISASLLYEISKALEVSIERLYQDFEHQLYERHNDGFNIMLIDDNTNDELVIREAIAEFSEKMSLHSIREGSKVLEFIRLLNDPAHKYCVKPDIILLALNLEKMSGLDILKNIKRDKYLNSTPVILLADSTNANDMSSSYNLHASGLIVKCSSIEEFKQQMHNVLAYWTQLVSLPNHNGTECARPDH